MAKNVKKGKLKKIGGLVLGGALTVFILLLFLSLNNIGEIFDAVKTADIKYVLIVVAALLMYAALSPLTLCILAKSKKTKASFGQLYVIGMTEHFFNGITPFSTGGQPFQVYSLNKIKVKPAESTGLLLMNFIIMMIATGMYALCSLFFFGRLTADPGFYVIAIIGFTMNFAVLGFMIALATSERLKNVLVRLLAALAGIKFLTKIIGPRVPAFKTYCEQSQAAFKELWGKKTTFLICLGVKLVTMGFYYVMTFYILRALNIDVGYDRLFFVVCCSAFAITAVVFLPTPGSSGGIEYAFKSIFVSIAGVSSAVAYGGMLLWRMTSYYLLMLLSLFFYIAFEVYYAKVYKKRLAELESTAEPDPTAEPEIIPDPTAVEKTEPEQRADVGGKTEPEQRAADSETGIIGEREAETVAEREAEQNAETAADA
ncbi:MAG: flippase-like domain-containing protein [Clostridiales bacterium]|jgi:uncharacterized protein (TIRG00374 family)|nr:flippase-like domain-containing protein [Clostridiales bacterium]